MVFLTGFIVSMLVTMILIPLVRSLGYRLGIVDIPNARKVHAVPIPRVGGIAIILGSALSMLIWLEITPLVIGYLAGAVLIVVFGIIDDKLDLNFKIKLVVQIVAALATALIGGIQIESFMLLNHTIELGPFFGPALTVLFIVIAVNAVNFADGLDGLAGGVSLLSFAVIAILAYRAGSMEVLLISVVVAGSTLGFLLFNNHPAQIFMGDGGSQFLGYSLATMALYLTQSVSTGLSAFLPLLIIGIPLLDFVYVIVVRLANGSSPFQPDKNHIHHRLMAAGLRQYGSVFAIYIIQSSILATALAFRWDSDTSTLVLFILMIAGTSLMIWGITKQHERDVINGTKHTSLKERSERTLKGSGIVTIAGYVVLLTVPAYVLISSLYVIDTPNGVTNTVTFFLIISVILAMLPISGKSTVWLVRYILYSTVLAVLFFSYTTDEWLPQHKLLISGYFIVLAGAVLLAIRYSKLPGLALKPVDVLIVTGALLLPAFDGIFSDDAILWFFAPHLLVMFYSVEFILQTAGHHEKYRWVVLFNILPLLIITLKNYGLI